MTVCDTEPIWTRQETDITTVNCNSAIIQYSLFTPVPVSYTKIFAIIISNKQKRYIGRVCTLTEHFIRNTIMILDRNSLCSQNSFSSLWHGFNMIVGTFLWDSGPFWLDNITSHQQTCQLHIHTANLLLHHILMVGRPLSAKFP